MRRSHSKNKDAGIFSKFQYTLLNCEPASFLSEAKKNDN